MASHGEGGDYGTVPGTEGPTCGAESRVVGKAQLRPERLREDIYVHLYSIRMLRRQ